MKLIHLPVAALLAGVLALGGCAKLSSPEQYYQLDSGVTELSQRSSGVAVLVGPLDVADYLQRNTLVQRQADNSISLDSSARWASSLPDDINQVLLRQLSAQLKSNRLALYSDQAGMEPDVQAVVSINRLDSGPEKPAVLEAQWRLLDKNGKLRDSRVVQLQEAHTGTVADQVRAQSKLLQELATSLSKAVQADTAKLASAAKAAEQARKRQLAAEEKPSSRQIPVVEPVRNRGDILRF
ncbi:PqiC family protein [Pseudomonas matsuisoli]|uniref:ABC-type transport auxiliary lipoprotein component domain-containing protein n=1 Tax=Pseudomonas matsuisoli TaxID=1515666 RepID=A0A917Q3C7_9PSED|nr:PqiC family protein [Pseudomonas matsuisoli]GGK10554.1 hypothetical protein GCM10009304_40670 [Pseudomonas matsuisoli]